ncbi:hypothetical protein AADZ91_09045 [Colwelliaceae bacterium 6441]
MSRMVTSFVIFSILLSMSMTSKAEVQNCNQEENIEFTTHDIFNLEDPDTIFLHRWGNFFHIKTNKLRYQCQRC